VHVFSQPGSYYVALEVTGPGGSNTKFKANYIQVQTAVIPLNAAFTAAPLLGSAPLQVQFTNQSSGQWLNLLWDFGDGSTSTETNPLHTYQNAGSYNVLLTANSAGNQDTELKNNYIQVIALQEVVAIFTTTGTNGAAPYSVGFFNQSFCSVDSLLWNFGDGGTSTLTNPLHTFVNPGEYQVTLTAYGPLNTSTASKTILAESVAPFITQITDRPNDQGGYVYIEFKKSFYDNVIPGKSTESYTIQRDDDGHWVSLTSALAYGEAVYTIETATLADSVAGDNGLATYRVIAGMDEGTWISESAQGYSTDNLAPEAPQVLNYELGDEQLAFSWNQSQANDFDYFAIYKSNVSGTFAGTPVSIQATTSFSETIAPDEAWFYSITAFDRAGNQSAFSEEVSTLRSMNLAVPQGWSGISGYLNIYDPAIENVFEPLSGNLIILQNETGVFWPGQNINTLGNWQSSEGYQIKLAQPSGLTMKGTRLTNRSLQLAAGWNLIPVLAGQNTAIAGLFASTSLIMVKEVAGWRIYWPDYNISSLEVLEPGKAYFVLMASPATITFPAGATKSSLTNQSEMSGLTPWNLPTRTPSTHVVAFETTALAAFEPGDIVGAFTKNGWCAGLAQLETNTLALVAFGDDELTASADGFASAEMMNFSLFRPSTGETFGLQLNWNPAMNSGNFAGHGISVVSGVKLSPTAINETAASGISIFPNPTHGIFTIQGISNPAILKIFNAFGVEVSNPVIDPQGNIDLSAQPRGVYFIRIQNGEKVSFEKVVLN
jgi:PKD repeat protein